MKLATKLAALLGTGVLAVTAVSAKTIEQSYLESCRKEPGVPVPVVVVKPRTQASFIGQEVDVEFTVDTTGKPSNISVTSVSDSAAAEAVVDAVRQWEFEPAHRNGAAVTTKVSLPVRFIDENAVENTYAAK